MSRLGLRATGPPKRKPRGKTGSSKTEQYELFPIERPCQTRVCFVETPLGKWLRRERRLARLAQQQKTDLLRRILSEEHKP